MSQKLLYVLGLYILGLKPLFRFVSLSLLSSLRRGPENSCTQRGKDPEAPSLGLLLLRRCSVECEMLPCRVFRTIKEARRDFLVLLFGESSQRDLDFFV